MSPPGTGGANGSAGAGGVAGAGELVGEIREFVDDQFQPSIPFSGTATVQAQARMGGLVEAFWDGSEPFRIAGLPVTPTAWLSVTPAFGLGLLPALHPVDTRAVQQVTLGLVPADVLDFIFLQLTIPGERLPGLAHVVLRLTDDADPPQGVSGVQVVIQEAADISYAVQGIWSDFEPFTDRSGLVVLGNIPSSAFPGRSVRVHFQGARTGFSDVRVASDSVSVVEIPLPEPP